jgi:predicted transcriptional regulator
MSIKDLNKINWKKNRTSNIHATFHLSPELVQKIKELAKRYKTTKSGLVEKLLRNMIGM